MTARPRTIIKICGLTHEEHVLATAEAGADLVGFVLWPSSVRALTRDRAIELAALAHARGLETVALVVDPSAADLADLHGFDRVQCHGRESCAVLASARVPSIKGFAFDAVALRAWDACTHAAWLLVDGSSGGGGAGFEHAALAALIRGVTKPVLLAGGLTPTNVATALRAVRTFGVDVSSGVERIRGVKDPELITAFCSAVRDADASITSPA
ncbi:MAG: phosphoribosylanthranilate isomerase [Phycisphaerae bacterium]|nr:phosphoribosylanthranilate isomerase [Phycisphaerae bacterium]